MREDAPREESCELLTRHWVITDGNGETERVDGSGVIGGSALGKLHLFYILFSML